MTMIKDNHILYLTRDDFNQSLLVVKKSIVGIQPLDVGTRIYVKGGGIFDVKEKYDIIVIALAKSPKEADFYDPR